MPANTARTLAAASRRVDTGMKLLRAGKITREEFEARKDEFKAVGDAIIADQLTGMAEARIERDQNDWAEGRITR